MLPSAQLSQTAGDVTFDVDLVTLVVRLAHPLSRLYIRLASLGVAPARHQDDPLLDPGPALDARILALVGKFDGTLGGIPRQRSASQLVQQGDEHDVGFGLDLRHAVSQRDRSLDRATGRNGRPAASQRCTAPQFGPGDAQRPFARIFLRLVPLELAQHRVVTGHGMPVVAGPKTLARLAVQFVQGQFGRVDAGGPRQFQSLEDLVGRDVQDLRESQQDFQAGQVPPALHRADRGSGNPPGTAVGQRSQLILAQILCFPGASKELADTTATLGPERTARSRAPALKRQTAPPPTKSSSASLLLCLTIRKNRSSGAISRAGDPGAGKGVNLRETDRGVVGARRGRVRAAPPYQIEEAGSGMRIIRIDDDRRDAD